MTENITACPHCAAATPPGALFCPTCHRWVFEQRLQQLMQEAGQAQQTNPMLASSLLRQAMELVTPGSAPFQTLEQHANALAAAAFRPAGGSPVGLQYAQSSGMPVAKSETWMSALLKTGGSMALSIYVYYRMSHSLPFAVGFVLLILIHELGHVVANWYYGIAQSPPIFIPYVGAVIWLRQNPPSAKAESVIGIAGPVAGTIGALVCYAAAFYTAVASPTFFSSHIDGGLLFLLSGWAMIMNLFNLLPIAPLDGGRVGAAITPWLWPFGLILYVAAIFWMDRGRVEPVTLLVGFWILQSAWPRIRRVLFQGEIKNPYYRVGFAGRLYVIFSYVMLIALLVTMLYKSELYRLLRF